MIKNSLQKIQNFVDMWQTKLVVTAENGLHFLLCNAISLNNIKTLTCMSYDKALYLKQEAYERQMSETIQYSQTPYSKVRFWSS